MMTTTTTTTTGMHSPCSAQRKTRHQEPAGIIDRRRHQAEAIFALASKRTRIRAEQSTFHEPIDIPSVAMATLPAGENVFIPSSAYMDSRFPLYMDFTFKATSYSA